jgi:hypothetical protein
MEGIIPKVIKKIVERIDEVENTITIKGKGLK